MPSPTSNHHLLRRVSSARVRALTLQSFSTSAVSETHVSITTISRRCPNTTLATQDRSRWSCQLRTSSTDCRSTSATSAQEVEPLPPYSFTFEIRQKRQRQSQIRASLQAWSEQNERDDSGLDESVLPYTGKIHKLPNALFINTEEGKDEHDIHEDTGDEQSIYRGGRTLSPGSLFVYASDLIRRQDVVYLGDIGNQSLLLCGDGSWVADKLASKRFNISRLRGVVVPDFLTEEEVQLLRSHMPQRDVKRALEPGVAPVSIGAQGTLPDQVFKVILPKFKTFSEAIARFERDYQQHLEHIYDDLAHESSWRTIPIRDLSQRVLGISFDSMTWPMKKAFVNIASNCHPLMIAVQTADTVSYCIGPKTLHQDVKAVEEWARQYQEAAAQAALGKNVSELLRTNPLTAFIDRARRIIMKSRKIRTPTSLAVLGVRLAPGSSDSMQKISSNETFTKEDMAIIRYLWEVAYRRPTSNYPQTHASLIARAIGAYPEIELRAGSFRMMLQELGVADGWTELQEVNLPLPGNGTSPHIDALHAEAIKSASDLTVREDSLASSFDSLAHLRKDWLEVEGLCIDSYKARNLEDAMSLEPSEMVDGGYWIHTHIAHPTAFLDLNHPITKYARKRGVAYYSPYEGRSVQPMVPNELIRQFSLKNDSPVLTISTLITMDGNVHEVEVKPGILRYVKRLAVESVNKAMESTEVEQALLTVGNVSHLPKGSDSVAARKNDHDEVLKYLPLLNVVKDLLRARRVRRRNETDTPARFPRWGPSLNILANVPEGGLRGPTVEPYHWSQDAGITIWGDRFMDMSGTVDEHRANDVVAQLSRLAAESLGRWLADRNIPAVYIGNDNPSGFSIEEVNNKSQHSEISLPLYTRTSYPRPLLPHNIKQYAGCTSPMRRFMDMLNHFQVDSYLRYAAMNAPFNQKEPILDDSNLALSKADIETYLAEDASANDTMDDHSREVQRLLAFQALFRAFHLKEAALPEVMEVYIDRPVRRDVNGLLTSATGRLVPWGLPVQLEESQEGYERRAQIHEFLPVRLVNVQVNALKIEAHAVGPATKEQSVLGSIKCIAPIA